MYTCCSCLQPLIGFEARRFDTKGVAAVISWTLGSWIAMRPQLCHLFSALAILTLAAYGAICEDVVHLSDLVYDYVIVGGMSCFYNITPVLRPRNSYRGNSRAGRRESS
jgi:hypothetical protein